MSFSKPNKDGYWIEVLELTHDEESSSPDSRDVFGTFIPILPMSLLLNLVQTAVNMPAVGEKGIIDDEKD